MSSFSEKMASNEFDHPPQLIYDEDERPVREFFKFLYEYLEVAEKWTEMQRFGGEHPIVSVFLIVIMATFSIPIAVFTVFVISSLIFSFLGFLFFEGTVLAIGTFVLGGILFFVGLFGVGFSIFLVASYYMVQMSGNILTGIRDKLRAIQMGGDDDKEE